MGRRSYGGGIRSSPRPAAGLKNPPKAAADRAPPPAPIEGGNRSILGQFGASLSEGFFFSSGFRMAERVADFFLGPRVVRVETGAPPTPPVATEPSMTSSGALNACDIHTKALHDCLDNHESDISKCQFYMNMLNECRRNTAETLSPA